MSSGDFVIILREVNMHPDSMLETITSKFMPTSIIHVTTKDSLNYVKNNKPLFDSKYLVVIDSVSLFKETLSVINYENMFVVLHVETNPSLEEAIFLCREKDIPYKVFDNEFTRDHAHGLILAVAKQEVSKDVRNAILRNTGLNPGRIITAVNVCSKAGFSVKNVGKYVDKWMFSDTHTIIRILAGSAVTKVSKMKALHYLHSYRHMYKYIRKSLVKEIDGVIFIYEAKIRGDMNDLNILDFMDKNRISHSKVSFALELFQEVSLPTMVAMREFVKKSQLLDLIVELTR